MEEILKTLIVNSPISAMALAIVILFLREIRSQRKEYFEETRAQRVSCSEELKSQVASIERMVTTHSAATMRMADVCDRNTEALGVASEVLRQHNIENKKAR